MKDSNVRNVEREWSIEEIIEALQQWKDMFYSESETKWLMNKAAGLLKERELVRCKDCGHQGNRCLGVYCMFIECKKTGSIHHENWFCADGERRTDDA